MHPLTAGQAANPFIREQVAELRQDFAHELPQFLARYDIGALPDFAIQPDNKDAAPVYLLTGAAACMHDGEKFPLRDTHVAVTCQNGDDVRQYLLNNTAVLAQRLLDEGHRVILHTATPAETAHVFAARSPDQLQIIEGGLYEPAILPSVYGAAARFAKAQPISEIGFGLYQSFKQENGLPFKPLHIEEPDIVERAASRRIRFIYTMAAMGYDLLINRDQANLRILSLSALASVRASYGLLADATDKFMNELAWRTFHLESNIATGKPVTIMQLNAGITTAGDSYEHPETQKLVKREAIADGFPLDDAVLQGHRALPQMSADHVARVGHALLTTPYGDDPNARLLPTDRSYLLGGFDEQVLTEKFAEAIQSHDGHHVVGPRHLLPDHLYSGACIYGRLPTILPGDYCRVSVTPPGQRF